MSKSIKINQNKIINQIFKKLLLSGFKKQLIWNLINLKKEFVLFDHFLIYLFMLANDHNKDDLMVKMCYELKSYLSYLITTHKLNLLLEDLQFNQQISKLELSLFIKENNNQLKVYQTNNDECILIINECEYEKLNDELINVIMVENNILLNAIINQKLIYLFVHKNDNNFVFLNKYYAIDESFIFINDFLCKPSLILSLISDYQLNLQQIYNNYQQKFNNFKTKILSYLDQHNIEVNQELNEANCYFIFNERLFNFLLTNKNWFDLVKKQFPYLFEDDFKINLLIPYISRINEFELVQLTNDFNILNGHKTTYDYFHNVFCLVNYANIAQKYKIPLFSAFYNQFDLLINKIMMSTINEPNVIYLFKQIKNKYLYLGMYYTHQLISVNDSYFFKLQPISLKQKISNLIKINSFLVSNNYLNSFQNLTNTNPTEVKYENVQIKYLNSFNKKINWLKKQVNFDWNNYINKYKQFKLKFMYVLANINQRNWKWLINNKLIDYHNLAQELTKTNQSNQKLINYTYDDYDLESKNEIINYLLTLI